MDNPSVLTEIAPIFVDLLWVVGSLSTLFALALWLFTELPKSPLPGRSLFDKQVRREEMQDYRNPKIKFGGYIGILKKLLVFGIGLIGLWLVIRLFTFMLSE